ncbi:MAG: FtsB family cell division protein [Alphaproteobacteria bacterium]
MGLLVEIKRRAGDAIAPVLGVCVVGYFAYHSIVGDRGLAAWIHLDEQIRTASAQLSDPRAERETLERRVTLLSPRSLDRDLLDERARLVLNFAHRDEVVVLERGAAGR